MALTTRINAAALNVRTAHAFGLGAWRLLAGRMPWQKRRRRGLLSRR